MQNGLAVSRQACDTVLDESGFCRGSAQFLSGGISRDASTDSDGMKGKLKIFLRVYKAIALTVFNSVVALVVLDLLAAVVLDCSRRIRGHSPVNPVVDKYGWERLEDAYPGLSRPELNELLNETWSRSMIFEPFVQFRERPFDGTYIHVDGIGLRRVRNQCPWPPSAANLNVFVFGGSTAFGFGVADFETIPSLLQEQLRTRFGERVAVYNFSTGGYYSSQEDVRFERLLAKGFVPQVAVFVDGLNEFTHEKDEPGWSEDLAEVMKDGSFVKSISMRAKQTALGDLLHSLRRKMVGEAPVIPARRQPAESRIMESICERYLRNQRLIQAAGDEFKVKCEFIWQPIPTYGYDLRFFGFDPNWTGADHKTGYEIMAKILREQGRPRNFLWLADMQADAKEALYVDQVHYNPRMNGLIASRIAEALTAPH
jgi:hypothetical protein